MTRVISIDLHSAEESALLSACLFAGVICGLLEAVYGLWGSPLPAELPQLIVAWISMTLVGLVGFCWGLVLWGIRRASQHSRQPVVALGLLVGPVLALAYVYEGAQQVIIAGVAILTGVWLWWRLRLILPAFLLWCGLLIALAPLFQGHAMVMVFSEWETLLIFCASLVFVAMLSTVMASALKNRSGNLAMGVGTVLLCVGASYVLIVLSSVFLVRLWGFRTMEFLEVTLIAVKVNLIAVALLSICALIPAVRAVTSRVVTLVAVLVLLLSFVAASRPVVSGRPVVHQLLARMPDTELLVDEIAALLDHDRDGYSTAFGYGDCDDWNPRHHPGAVDWPGNGEDENCFGGDLSPVRHRYYGMPIDIRPPARPRAQRQRRPRVAVLVVIDTLRSDAIDFAGGSEGLTPELAQIALESTRFDNAYAQSNNTLESFPFLFHLGFRNLPRHHPPYGFPALLESGEVESTAVFQSSTAWWNNNLDEVFIGFDRTIRPSDNLRNWPNEKTVSAALALLEEPIVEDRFILIHFESLHNFFTQRMEGDRMIDRGVNLSELARLWAPSALEQIARERYDLVLSEVDLAVGTLWRGLRQIEQHADLLCIFTSDHGEEFFEHGGLFHMGTLYEEVAKVPLLIYATGIDPKVQRTPVGIYRIPATILHWLGYSGEFLEAMNLLRNPVLPYEVFAYFSRKAQWSYRTFMVQQPPYKAIYDARKGHLEIYDLEHDPKELENLNTIDLDEQTRGEVSAQLDRLMFYMNYGDIAMRQNMQPAGRGLTASE